MVLKVTSESSESSSSESTEDDLWTEVDLEPFVLRLEKDLIELQSSKNCNSFIPCSSDWRYRDDGVDGGRWRRRIGRCRG